MKVIVNATPLIAFALIERLDLLRALFAEVVVPAEVYNEVVVQGAGKPGAQALARANWLQVVPSPPSSAIAPLLTGLDAGEIAVLLLAWQIHPDWVVIDERQARRIAFALGLPVKGTLGILLAAALAGLLTRQEALQDLQKLLSVGIRISPRWQNWLRTELDQL
jgi:predicted nucleic acid-binding protein